MDENTLNWIRKNLNDVKIEGTEPVFTDEELEYMYIENKNDKYLVVSDGWRSKASLVLTSDNIKSYNLNGESYTFDTKSIYESYIAQSEHYKNLSSSKKNVSRFFKGTSTKDNQNYSDLMGGKYDAE